MSSPGSRVFWEQQAEIAWVEAGRSVSDPNFDAFRHAYTSAVWTRLAGESIARTAGDYIEASNPRNFTNGERGARDMRSDLINNSIGREIGKNAHPGWPNQVIAQDIIEVLDRGGLVTNPQTDSRTSATAFPSDLLPSMSVPFPWQAEYWSNIRQQVSDWWRAAVTPRPRDPLAIDLDGDGIETTAVVIGTTPTLFDHDADGVRTGTGWLKPDDAWLVLDRNGNGTIDSGRELFGVDTMVTVTETIYNHLGEARTASTTRNARTGFEALRTLDTGNGTADSTGYADGVFNASDTQFANVRIWRDLNQDGISQATELQGLAAAGIASISLNATNTNTDLGNGNVVTGTAVVTRSNGTTTHIDGVQVSANNLDLADNPFYRQFTDTVPLSAAALALPEMGGSGWLRDLREAMSLGDNRAAALTSAVAAFSASTSRTQQLAQLEHVLIKWGETAGKPILSDSVRDYTSVSVEMTQVAQSTSSTTWRYRPDGRTGWGGNTGLYVSVEFESSLYKTAVVSSLGLPGTITNSADKELLGRISVLEAFNGSHLVDFTRVASNGGTGSQSTQVNSP